MFGSIEIEGFAQPRRRLPHVTLIAVDGTPDASQTERALMRSASLMQFARVRLLSPVRPASPTGDYDWTEIPPLSLAGYNRFCLAELHKYIETTHALTVQNDSWIVNPAGWDDAWLTYDYIGAPWRPSHSGTEYRVGNSGFCLRSKRLLEATAVLPNDFYVWRGKRKEGCRDDVITCVMYREQLEARGLQFAPVPVAARFSFETPTPEAPALTDQFGAHEFRRRKQG